MSSSIPIPIYYQVSGRNISVVKLKEGENLINLRQTIVNNEALDVPDSTLILSATTPDTEIQINNDDYFKIQCGKSLQKLVELLYNNDDNPIRVNSGISMCLCLLLCAYFLIYLKHRPVLHNMHLHTLVV